MNFVFRKFTTKTLSTLSIVRYLHKDKPIQFVQRAESAYDFLEIPSQERVVGHFSIIQALSEKALNSRSTDVLWYHLYTFSKSRSQSIEEQLDAFSAQLATASEGSKGHYLGGKSLSEADIVAYLRLQRILQQQYAVAAPIVHKNERLRTWYKRTASELQPILTGIAKQFKLPEWAQSAFSAAIEIKASVAPAPKEASESAKPKQEKNADKKEAKKEVDPSYVSAFHALKLTRLNKDKGPVLPDPKKRNVLITSALPYVNNIPHLGNIIGCVLPGDVYGRYCRLRGYNTLYICGSDEYGTATEMAARKEGLTPRQICDKYWKIHDEVYRWFDIDFDYFGRTSTQKHTDIAQEIFLDLNKNGYITQKTIKQCYCANCETFLADRYVVGTCPFCQFPEATGDQCDKCQKLLNPEQLVDLKCDLCKKTPEIRDTEHCYIDLPRLQGPLSEWIKKSEVNGFWTDVAKNVTWEWINRGLQERCITRDLKWGTPVPLEKYKQKVMYVWFDAPIGYVSITANYTDKWQEWWRNPSNVEYVEFMAKDNIPFHSIMFPASKIGTARPWTLLHHLSATHYLNYEDGKFSKRKGIGVFGDEASRTAIPVEVWRYYLLINRPEKGDTTFSWRDFGTKNNDELLPNLGNLCNRSLKFAYSAYKGAAPDVNLPAQLNDSDKKFLADVWKLFLEYIADFERVEIKKALKLAMDISSVGNQYLQHQAPWEAQNKASGRSQVIIGVTLNFLRFLSVILEPFMPSVSAKINFMLGLGERTADDEKLLQYFVEQNDPIKAIIGLVKSGQKLNQPVELFRTFTEDELAGWRQRFAGKQNPQQ